jgi:hypothetical protein
MLCALAAACDRDVDTETQQQAATCSPQYPGDPSCPDLPPGLSFVDVAATPVPIRNETTADLVARKAAADGRRTIAYRKGATETPLFTSGYPVYAQGIKVGTGTIACAGIATTVSDLTNAALHCRATTGAAWSAAVNLGARAWLTDLKVDPTDAGRAILTYKLYTTNPLDTSATGLQQAITCQRRSWRAGVLSAPAACTTPPLVGGVCNDNDRCTTNDKWLTNTMCRGTYVVIDGCSDPSACAYDVNKCPPAPAPGTTCNDGSPDTTNDKIQSDGQCVGDLL